MFIRFGEFIVMNEDTSHALAYATKAHIGQTRSDGTPYIAHPERVAKTIEQYIKTHNLPALIKAAYLHDTIEDTDTTQEDLEKLFGGLVASLVMELTSDKDKVKEMGKTAYLSQKMATMTAYALVLKLADRLDNVSDLSTAKNPAWRQKYKKETEEILTYIEKNRVLSGDHKQLISMIREKLKEVE